MARKMDKFRNDYESIKALDAKMTKMNKALRELKSERDKISAGLMKSMQTSTEGTIDGQVVMKVKTSVRKTATTARVMEFAPEVADKIILPVESKKIEVL